MKTKTFPVPKEEDDQRALFLWAEVMSRDYPELELLNASANGAWIPGSMMQKFATIKKLKALGCMRKGYPDIFLPVSRGVYCGLFIELKRKKGGSASKEQKRWLHRLSEEGYCAVMARGLEEAKAVILRYLR